MISYYRHDGGYIAVTDTSPAGFEGLVFVGRGGPIDAIEEKLFAVEELTDPVAVVDVPPSWCTALGYHNVEDFPLLDAAGENLEAEIPVRTPVVRPIVQRRSTPTPTTWRDLIWGNQDRNWQIGCLIGVVIVLAIFLW